MFLREYIIMATTQIKGGKQIASTDDIGFLEQLIATMVKSTTPSDWKGKVDPERVYSTGFSMGCMMSHRLALERSKIIAGINTTLTQGFYMFVLWRRCLPRRTGNALACV